MPCKRRADGCNTPLRIRFPHGYSAARVILRGRRTRELLAGRRAARRDAAGRQPADPLAREAPRTPASRPVRSPGRADRGRPAALPERPANARPRATARRGGHRRQRGRARRQARNRRVHGARRLGGAAAPVRVPAGEPQRARGIDRLGHPDDRRPGGRAGARCRDRRRRPTSSRRDLRAVVPRRGRARVPARTRVCGPDDHARRAPGGAAGRDAGRCRRPPGDRRRPPSRRPPRAAPGGEARARPPGVREERRGRRVRDHVHLALRDRGRALDGGDRNRAGRRPRARAGDLAGDGDGPDDAADGRRVPRVRPRAPAVIVRWGLDQLASLLHELGIERPFLVASPRWDELKLPVAARWTEIPSDRITVPEGVDGILAVGGGSAIDTAKAASAASGLPVVSVPTTYSGSEWVSSFGVRKPDRRAEADRDAREAATRIAAALPAVAADEQAVGPRKTLLAGASHAGAALASAGLGLGHAMAQALGGRYGLPHGTMNAITLPLALRFNMPVAAEEIESFGDAMGTDEAVGKVESLARLGGFKRLRAYGVFEDELGDVAKVVVERPGAKANPRPATPGDVEELLRSAW